MSHHPHLLTDPKLALTFVLAGNATFTIVSKATKQRFTYRVRLSDDGRVHFVSLFAGGVGDSKHYTYMGVIRANKLFERTKGSKIDDDAPSMKAFVFMYRHLTERNALHAGLEFWHEGTCCRCARQLTVPRSIEIGIGPECLAKMGLSNDNFEVENAA